MTRQRRRQGRPVTNPLGLSGADVREVSRTTGVPVHTLQRWMAHGLAERGDARSFLQILRSTMPFADDWTWAYHVRRAAKVQRGALERIVSVADHLSGRDQERWPWRRTVASLVEGG